MALMSRSKPHKGESFIGSVDKESPLWGARDKILSRIGRGKVLAAAETCEF
jgi:hypothetical protein